MMSLFSERLLNIQLATIKVKHANGIRVIILCSVADMAVLHTVSVVLSYVIP